MDYNPPTICHMLREEGLIANQMGIHKFLQKHRETSNIVSTGMAEFHVPVLHNFSIAQV